MDFGKTFRRWASYRKTVRELSVLDDRELNDLGITRGDIQPLAREHAERI
ncbi:MULTISPECIES: DUF1127 domain-containing protein [Maritalea]|jgi:uncharacterized protein YjiS (DUF1127 family)|uniref:YjiS-like domain-containing protein n=2 Tax=Maritalea TaxID=623276 RepID=A0A2R4MFM4_9HYPH|nr:MULTISPECIES: DUF1127 domain-containing protein [Maritalea]AVX04696.1 hypothetical protein MXMO3_02177 [Maritalea myrionectae]MCF4098295.1 DUF1127 domain-containing protein [Maritalea mediterranea]